jgi:hypothetical protein
VSNASEEMRNKGNRNNFPGFDHPLEFCKPFLPEKQ